MTILPSYYFPSSHSLTILLSYYLTTLQEGLLDPSPPGGAPGGAPAAATAEDAAPDSARVLHALEATPGVLSALIEQGVLPTGKIVR